MRQPRSTCLTESGPVQVRTERCGWTRFVETGHHQGRQHPALGQGLRLQPPTAIEPKFRPGQSPGAQPSASRPNGGPAVGGGYPPPAYRRRSALISLRNPVAIACPFQACASAIAAPVAGDALAPRPLGWAPQPPHSRAPDQGPARPWSSPPLVIVMDASVPAAICRCIRGGCPRPAAGPTLAFSGQLLFRVLNPADELVRARDVMSFHSTTQSGCSKIADQ